MKRWALILVLTFGVFAFSADAQSPQCPVGWVCFTQVQANDIFDKLGQLVAAKDLNIKLLSERGVADQALANALKVIDGHIELHKVDDQIILKKDQIIALYEQVIKLQMTIIENLEKRLSKPKSTWDKIASVLKTVVTLAAGIALGRGM